MRIGTYKVQFATERTMNEWRIPEDMKEYCTNRVRYTFLAPRNADALFIAEQLPLL